MASHAPKRQINLYKSISGWMLAEENVNYEQHTGREIIKLVIGEVVVGKTIVEYITEDIYRDILDSILSNPHSYQVYTKLRMIPQITITFEGIVIAHNPDTVNDIEIIRNIINKMSPADICDAYIEMRLNMGSYVKLDASSDLLDAKIRKESGKNYSSVFIRACICRIVEDKFFSTDNSELANWIRSLSYTELVTYANELIRYKMSGEIKDEFLIETFNDTKDSLKELNELSDTINSQDAFIKVFEDIMGKELVFRLYKGTLKEA